MALSNIPHWHWEISSLLFVLYFNKILLQLPANAVIILPCFIVLVNANSFVSCRLSVNQDLFKAQCARDNHKSYIQEMANVLNSHTYFHESLKAFTIEKTKLRNTCLPYLLINICILYLCHNVFYSSLARLIS